MRHNWARRLGRHHEAQRREAAATVVKRQEDKRLEWERATLLREVDELKLQWAAEQAAKEQYPDIADLFVDVYKLEEHPSRKAFMLDQFKANHLQALDRQAVTENKPANNMKGMRWSEL